jgi:hypothetical protein
MHPQSSCAPDDDGALLAESLSRLPSEPCSRTPTRLGGHLGGSLNYKSGLRRGIKDIAQRADAGRLFDTQTVPGRSRHGFEP